jgi:hypothetical protein
VESTSTPDQVESTVMTVAPAPLLLLPQELDLVDLVVDMVLVPSLSLVEEVPELPEVLADTTPELL